MPQILAVGAIVGFFLCLLAVMVFISRRRFLEDPQKYDCWLGLPVIASIPHSASPDVLLAFDATDDLALEGFRSLCTAIDLMIAEARGVDSSAQKGGIMIAMTGAATGVGTSFVSANLAAALSASGRRVLLVDANLPAGSLHQWFDVESAPGLSDWLSETCGMHQAVRESIRPSLSFLPCGGPVSDSMSEARFADVASQCRATFDIVVLATSPIAEQSDAFAIARESTLALLIARSGRHTQATLDEVTRSMEVERIKARGLIFNDQAMVPTDYQVPAP